LRPTLWAGRLDTKMATRNKHTPEQVVRKLATADRMLNDGKDVADVCLELQVSEQTYYRWRNQFGGMKPDARVVISDWKEDYNHRRRHSALGYEAPAVYAAARTHQ
jgi:transposase-like protein